MSWLEELKLREEHLRGRIALLRRTLEEEGTEPGLGDGEERFRSIVGAEVAEMEALLEDYLCGRNEEERARMSYQVCLNLPLFSHLRSLYTSQQLARA
jgi:hypothetical protein